MTLRSLFLPEAVQDYLVAIGVREPEVLRRLREETAALPEAHYQIAPEEGQLLGFLVELVGARRVLDIGTFTGYSALSAALALPPEGRVVTLDVTDRFAAIARRAWDAAGMAGRIEQRFGPALDALDRLIDDRASFDMAFIDADKESYDAYYERTLRLVRLGGLILIDNTLWRGRVLDPADRRAKTEFFRTFNRKLHADPRIALAVLPIGDGVTLARPRPTEAPR